MANNGSIDSGGYQGRVIRFSWSTASTSGNNRTISYSFTAVGGSSSYYYHHNEVFKINGQTVYTGSSSDYIKTGTVLKSGTFTINQNETQQLTVNMNGGIYTYSDNINTTKSWDLDTLITAPTINSLNISNRTLNTLTVSFTCSKADTFYYKLSSQPTWTQGADNVTSGSFTFNNLEPNKTYTINFLARNWLNKSTGSYAPETETRRDIQGTTFQIATLNSVPNVNIGSSHTITWNNPSGATTSLKLCKTDNSTIQDFGTVTGTSKSITPNADTFYELTKKSNTYTARYIITTTQNNKSYTNSKDFVLNVTNSNPVFTNFDYADINDTTLGLTGTSQILVKGYSKIRGIITPENKAEAINKANMTENGAGYKFAETGTTNTKTANYSTSTVNIDLPNAISTNKLTMSAIDSRGNITEIRKELSNEYFKEYSPLIIEEANIERQNNGVSSNATLKFNGTFWNNNFGNVDNTIKSVSYIYKETNATDYSSPIIISATASDNRFSGTFSIWGDKGADGFTVEKSFNIRLIVSDELSTKTYDLILGSGTPAIAVYKDNVAIGKKYDTSQGGKLQVNGDIKANNVRDIKTASGSTHTNYSADKNLVPDIGFVSFWNGAYDNANHSNLTYAYQGTIQCKPTSLYDNASGTTGTVTLSETAGNFSFLEIYYFDNDNEYLSVKVFNPNNKSTRIVKSLPTNGALYIKGKKLTISGTSITSTEEYQVYTENMTNWYSAKVTYMKIYKVLGYK